MQLKYFKFFYFSILFQFVFSQPDIRFNPFDWNLYTQSGSINSISFGDRYAFIGTSGSGVVRFNVNNNRFEEPITTAQGLSSNFITAVHYAENGMLWIATRDNLHYSLSGYGDWRSVSLMSIGLSKRNYINRLGSDGKDIWAESSGMLFKLDGNTGIPLETMIRQTKNISWSSGNSLFYTDFSDILLKYTITGGWMNTLNTFINPDGENIKITTFKENDFNQIIIGCEDGTFFVGNKNMRILEPHKFGLSSKDVFSFDGNSSLWAGGRTYGPKSGISYIDIDRNIYDQYLFKNFMNINETPIFSIASFKKMVFFGGDENIIIYNKDDDEWNQIFLPRGLRNGFVKNIIKYNENIWIGTPNGLQIVDYKSKNIVENEITDFLKNVFIHDLLIFKDIVYIATESGLLIYDFKNDSIYEYLEYGYKDKDIVFPSSQTAFTAIALSKNYIFFSTRESIIKLDTSNRKWSTAVNSVIFRGQEIIDFDVNNNDMFIATAYKLTYFNTKKNTPEYFNYNFLGNINKIKVDSRKVWVGTSEGIVTYRYK